MLGGLARSPQVLRMAQTMPTLTASHLLTDLHEIKARRGEPPWSDKVVISDGFTVSAICQPPGYANDRHYHIRDECWFVAEGEIIWHFDGGRDVHAKVGDFVFAPKGAFHLIEPVGDRPSIRIAISVTGEPHRYAGD